MALFAISPALPVLAQETTEAPAPVDAGEISVSLALTGPPGCGSESDLASRIAWRTSRVRIVPVGASERRLEVALDVAEGSATATLSLTLPNGRRATRVLRAATCDEAIDAAALVAAVTLDPTASTATTPLDAGAAGTGATGGMGGTAAGPAPSARPPDGRGGSSGTDAASRSELSASVFVPAELISGPAPSLLYGVGFGVMGVWERDSVISPALRLSFAHFFGQEFQELGGTAYFSLTEGNVDLCPVRFGNEVVGFFLCASFAFGQLTAKGRETNDAEEHRRGWYVLGGTPLLEIRPADPFEVQLFGTIGAPLTRDQFQFGCPNDMTAATDCKTNIFHTVPSVSVQGGVALGVFFR
jgi:hypothetical protein